ncbi:MULTISPECIES: hypothetical protein [unclassified Mycobacterium]|uniref:hypothetical protein n=1 Tax=unclassified Mycobacterium TaxID=2642494 RepID=UPI00343E5FB3
MTEPSVFADSGRFVVAEDGPKVLVIDRGRTAPEVMVLVLTIFSLVFGGFGVVSLFSAFTGTLSLRSLVIGGFFFAIGVVSLLVMNRINESIERARSMPLSTMRPVAVFDRRHRVYLDADGEVVAPLDQVRFERRMQMTSSASKLVAVTPRGARDLLRGTPFNGVGKLDGVLTDLVHAGR